MSESTARRGVIDYLREARWPSAVVAVGALSLSVYTEHQSNAAQAEYTASLQHIAKIITPNTDVQQRIVDFEPVKPEDLPNYGERSTAQQQAELLNATVQLVRRNNAAEPWSPLATAVLTETNGNLGVMTAAHAFPEAKKLAVEKGETALLRQRVNLSRDTQYAIAKPEQIVNGRLVGTEPLGQVREVMVTGGSDDVAYLSVGFRSIAQNSRTTPPTFSVDGQTFLKVTEGSQSVAPPLPGETVTMYTLPQQYGYAVVKHDGIYLGRGPAELTDGSSVYDYVGLTLSENEKDPCKSGASGSMAVTATSVLGPLSTNVELVMKVNGEPQFVEHAGSLFDDVSLMTGTDASQFNRVCRFSAFSAQQLADMSHMP